MHRSVLPPLLTLLFLLLGVAASACDEPGAREAPAPPSDLAEDGAADGDGLEGDAAELPTDAPADGDGPDEVVVLPGPALPFGVVYLANTSLEVPVFTPVDAGGVGAPIVLGPLRPGGYGAGAVFDVGIQVAPGGDSVVVLLTERDGRVGLYGLDTDGADVDAPRLLATVERSSGAVSVFGEQVLFADGDSLFAVALDGSTPPRELARTPDGSAPHSPYLAGAHVMFVADGRVYAVALDGSQADAPRRLLERDSLQEPSFAATLPDGRVLVAHGQALHALWPDGRAPALRLTPQGREAALVGVLDGGKRLVVTLAGPASSLLEVAVVASDGGAADAPLVLHTVQQEAPLLLAPGGALIVAQRPDGDQVHVEELSLETPGAARLITAPVRHLRLGPLTPDGSAVLGCLDDDIVRIERSGDATSTPAVLLETGARCTLEGLTGVGSSHVFYWTEPQEGGPTWWIAPLEGSSPPVEVEHGAWPRGWPTPTPRGVVGSRLVASSGLLLRRRDGVRTGPIGGWLETELHADDLELLELPIDGEDVPMALVRLDARHPTRPTRWFVADLRDPEPTLLPLSPATLDADARVAVLGTRILVQTDQALVALDAHPARRGVAEHVTALAEPWLWLEARGIVLSAQDGVLRAVDGTSGASWPVLVLPESTTLDRLAFVEATDQVVAVVRSGAWHEAVPSTVLAVPLDGSRADAPVLLADLPAEHPVTHLEAVPGQGRVLVVPHEAPILTVPTDGSATPVELAPGYTATLWRQWQPRFDSGAERPEPPSLVRSAPSSTPDGAWTALVGAEHVLGARSDGSAVVELAGPGRPLGGAWLAPDGRTLFFDALTGLGAVPIDGSAPARELVAQPAQLWPLQLGDDGRRGYLQLRAQILAGNGLWSVPVSMTGDAAHRVVELERSQDAGMRLAPGGRWLVYACDVESDPRLCGVAVGGLAIGTPSYAPVHLTGADDTVETLVGFVELEP